MKRQKMSKFGDTAYDDTDEWDSVASLEDMFETYKPTFLHDPNVMYEYQYGVDLDEFVGWIDPLKQFIVIREIGSTGVIQPQNGCSVALSQRKAFIAAAQLTNTMPFGMDPDLPIKELGEQKLHARELMELTRKRSVYFSNKADDIPIVIDTGASMSVTPCKDDFIDEIQPTHVGDLQGLSGSMECQGQSLVQWTVRDVFGSVRIIQTHAYYVPKATIRLYSLQQYFQEQDAGEFWCNAR